MPLIFLLLMLARISALHILNEKLTRILAFGDSLTEGLLSNHKIEPFYPYAVTLQGLMQQLGNHIKVVTLLRTAKVHTFL
jgi:hypothetical protein